MLEFLLVLLAWNKQTKILQTFNHSFLIYRTNKNLRQMDGQTTKKHNGSTSHWRKHKNWGKALINICNTCILPPTPPHKSSNNNNKKNDINPNYNDLPWQSLCMQILHIERFLAKWTCKPVPKLCVYWTHPMCKMSF